MPESNNRTGISAASLPQGGDALLRGIQNMDARIHCSDCQNPMMVNLRLSRLLAEHPEMFWFEGKWRCATGHPGLMVYPFYTVQACELAGRRAALESAAELVRRACDDADQARFARNVYEWFLENVEYDLSTSGQTAYDALVCRRAVCKGISKAFQWILQGAGIQASLRQGRIGDAGRHVWNLARLNGICYNIDVSCGYAAVYGQLPPERRAAGYFAVSDATMRRTHNLLPGNEWFPACEQDLDRRKWEAWDRA